MGIKVEIKFPLASAGNDYGVSLWGSDKKTGISIRAIALEPTEEKGTYTQEEIPEKWAHKELRRVAAKIEASTKIAPMLRDMVKEFDSLLEVLEANKDDLKNLPIPLPDDFPNIDKARKMIVAEVFKHL